MTFKEYTQFQALNECTSVGICVDDKVLLAKNRDRTYYPKIKIVRELINGIETAYMYDEDTDYSEGMNAAGIGILNTTLQGKKDENEGRDKLKKHGKRTRLSADGNKIRRALGFTDVKKVVESLDLYDRGLGGHTTVGYPGGFISIEKLRFGKPEIKTYGKGAVIVRTNHGIRYPDQGYQHGKDRESSLSRAFYANKEARNVTLPDELLPFLRKHHEGIPGYLEPYRTNYKVWTSSQILLNLTDLSITFAVDENADFVGIENRLPVNYTPKIDINVQFIETILKVRSSESN